MTYTVPLKDMRFILQHMAEVENLAKLPGYEHATPDVVEAVLEEACRRIQRFCAGLR
mgnify:CR=1 FL=1